jgi:hypothetical protein
MLLMVHTLPRFQVFPRVLARLDDAITEARARITPEDARGFFKPCGFPLPAQ